MSMDEAEIKFYDHANEMIASKDPLQAFTGRLVKAVFPNWINALDDSREVSSQDKLEVVSRISAWLLAASVVPLVKEGGHPKVKEAVGDAFIALFNAAYDEHVEFIQEKKRTKT